MKLLTIFYYLSLAGMLIAYLALFQTYDLLDNAGDYLIISSLLYVCYGIFAYVVYKTKRAPLVPILFVFGIATVILLIIPTNLSLDMYRYYWDGWLLKSGINPYLILPNDPQLAVFRQSELFTYMEPSYNDVYTVYPPIAQLIYVVAHTAYQLFSFAGAKFIMALPVIILGIYFYKRLEPWLFALFILNPLLLFESFNGAHIDAWGILFLTFAVDYFLRHRYRIASFFLACAVLTKLIPVIFFPFFFFALWRTGKFQQLAQFTGIFFGTMIAFYLPFILQSLFPLYRYLSWVQDNEFNAAVYRYLYADILPWFDSTSKELARKITGIGFVVSIAYLLRYNFSLLLLLSVGIAFIVFSPAVYPWYSLYFIPLVFLYAHKSKDYKALWMLIVMQFLINLTYFEWARGYSEEGGVIMRALINLEYLTLLLFVLSYRSFFKKGVTEDSS